MYVETCQRIKIWWHMNLPVASYFHCWYFLLLFEHFSKLIHHLFISGSYIVNRHCPRSYASSYSVIESAYEKIACVSAAATDFCGIYIQLALAEILFIHRLSFWLSYIDDLWLLFLALQSVSHLLHRVICMKTKNRFDLLDNLLQMLSCLLPSSL